LSVIVCVAIAPFWSGDSSAQRLPVPPCAGPPFPAAGDVGAALNQLVWIDDELAADWSPPPCIGWTKGPARVLLAAAGRFAMSGDTDELVAILARISAMTEIVYWSSTRSKWRKLFKEAVALAEPDRQKRRADFTAEEFEPGASPKRGATTAWCGSDERAAWPARRKPIIGTAPRPTSGTSLSWKWIANPRRRARLGLYG
jgi:hypothetical protein